MFDSLSKGSESPAREANMGVCNVSVDPAEDSDDDIYTAPTSGQGSHVSEGYKCGGIINRNDRIYSIWQRVLMYSILMSTCFVIYMATLDSTVDAMGIIINLCDVLFIVEIVLSFFTTYTGKGGIQVYNRKKILRRYLLRTFIVDLVSSLPLEFLAFLASDGNFWKTLALYRLNRLLRVYKIFLHFDKLEDDLDQSTTITRGKKYFSICLLTTHFLTCGWFAMACEGRHEGHSITCKNGSWPKEFDLGFEDVNVDSSVVYTTSLYWAVATATSTGYGDIYAVTIGEKWYAVFGMLAGIAVFFGMLLGGMTSLLTNLDAHRSSYVHRFQMINKSLKERAMEKQLSDMVASFYEYLWRQKKGVVADGVYDKLPLILQAEIAQATNSETIQKAPIFNGLDSGLVRMLSLSFKHVLCLPNQIIIKRGDIGSQMFFIHNGEVEVMHENDDESAVATLKTGKIFGEVSLVFSLPRTATVRAKTHCDLMVLEKADLQRILRHFPDAAQMLQDEARKRLKIINEISNNKKESTRKAEEVTLNQPKWLRRASFMPVKEMEDDLSKVGTLKLSNSVEILRTANIDSTEDIEIENQTSCFSSKMNNICCPTSTISTNTKAYNIWQDVMVAVAILNCFIHPYMAAFPAYDKGHGYNDTVNGLIPLVITYLFDVLYIVDIVINFRAYDQGGDSSLKVIALQYVKRPKFWTDLLSIIPLEVFALTCSGGASDKWRVFALLRLNRLLKASSIQLFFQGLEASLYVPIALVRSARLILYIILLSHWAACLMFIIACYGQGCGSKSWFVERQQSTNITTPIAEYVTSIYWAVATMTSTGYGDISANTTVGRILALTLMLIGLLLYGYCLSLMAATLSNADTPRVRFQEKLFAVKSYMKEHHVHVNLRQEVMTYMNLLWDKYGGSWVPGEKPIMYDVPLVLQEDIAFHSTSTCLEKIPLFTGIDENFLRCLSRQLTAYLFSPGDVIICAGDVGTEMYMIREGWCKLTTPDRSTVTATLGPGEYIGEVGLIYPENRPFNAIAVTHCVLDMIDMSKLRETLDGFQLFKEQFLKAEENKAQLIDMLKRHTDEITARAANVKSASIPGSLQNVGETSACSTKSFKKTTAGSVPNADYLDPFKNLNFVNKIFASLLMRRTFHPEGRFLTGWTSLMVTVCVIVSFTVTLQASFLHNSIIMWALGFILDFIGLISLYLSFHIAYYNETNILVTHPLSTARNYLKTNFLLDFLSVFPFEVFAFAAYPNFEYHSLYLFSMVRLTRLIQLYRLPMVFTYLEGSIDRETGLLREIKFGFYSIIFVNWLTCAFFVMACPPNMSDDHIKFSTLSGSGQQCLTDSWLLRFVDSSATAGTGSLYIACLYWASATSVSVGYGDISAYKVEEMLISLLAMVLGVLFFGYIIAGVAASLANADAQRARFQEKLSAITSFLRREKVEDALQKRIFHYFDYVWLRTRGVDPNTLFNFLPLPLWGEVTLDLYEETLKGISLFKDAEKSFLKMLSRSIRPILFLKGQYVVRKFDMGQEMYFIKRGSVEVVSEDGKIVFAVMRAGDSFGEVALLFSVPRTASIRAGTNADLFYLTKSDLDNVLDLYPKVKESVLQVGEERRQQARQRSQAKAQAAVKSQMSAKAKTGSRLTVDSSSKTINAPTSTKNVSLHPPEDTGPQPITNASAHAVGFVPSIVVKGEEYLLDEEDEYNPPSDPIEALHEEEWEAGISDDDGEDLEEEYENENNNARQSTTGTTNTNTNQNNMGAGNRNQSNNDAEATDENETKKKETCLWFKKLLAYNRFTINPRSGLLHHFNSWMCFLGFVSVWILTYQATYQDWSLTLIILGYIFDVFFIAQIYINLHTSSFDEYGDLSENFEDVYRSYLKRSNGFAIDMIAALPLDIFAFAAKPGHTLTALFYLRLLRCVRLLRVNAYFSKWEKGLNINMLAARLTKFFVALVLLIHFLSCIWYTIACPLANCNGSSWVQLKVDLVNTAINAYCVCVYWTVATMTSTGYGDVYATTDLERGFASIVMIVGKLMFGFILGNIASTLSNAEIPKVQYQEQLGVLKMAMDDQTVPDNVKKTVVDYMVNLWFHNKGIEPHTLFTDTPPCLVAELFTKITDQMFATISIFQGTDDCFRRALSIRVKHQLFIPGNYVMRKGDVGQEAFFIHRGEVQVWSDEKPIQKLKAGEVFGEVSLLSPVSRQVDVSAVTHVVLLSLSLQDFDEVLMDFPTVAEHVHHVGYQRFKDILRPDYTYNKPYFSK